MFNNIGRKLKGLAIVMFILGTVGVLVGYLFLLGSAMRNSSDGVIITLIIGLIIGLIASWVSSWQLYAFGELVEKTTVIASNVSALYKICQGNTEVITKQVVVQDDIEVTAKQATKQGDGYLCPICHMSNDSMGPCERCGYVPNK